MNAVSWLREVETVGAKEFRHRLDRILRRPAHPYRVMLHNQPALAILPHEEFMELLEVLEELKDEGLLDRVLKKLQREQKKRHAWFFTAAWQRKEAEADQEMKARKTQRARSADELIQQLNA